MNTPLNNKWLFYLTKINRLSLVWACLLSGISATAQVKPTTTTAPPPKTPVTSPAAYPAAMPVNYIRTWTPSMPATDPNAVVSPSRTTGQVKQSTQYFDGLGRPLQTVTKRITPAGKDLVAPVVYDAFGRQVYQYLPYPQTTANTNDGKFKLDPFNNQKAALEGLNLYPGEQIYYGKTHYEASPLNRVLKTMAPGNSWAGSNRGVSQSYETNTSADGVRIWNIAFSPGSLPTSTASYDPGELFKQVTTDEAGNRAVSFKDKQGREILKKAAMSTGAGDGHSGWLCTYYVYDDLGNLRFVIPPKAVKWLAAHQWDFSSPSGGGQVGAELCFRYEYDDRKRLIIKKAPGAAEVQLVYDRRDRLVFTRDGNRKDVDEWLVTYYDGLNRPVETGIYHATTSRTGLQNIMNGATSSYPQIPAPADLSVSGRSGNTPDIYVATNSITLLPGFESGANDAFTAYIDPNAMIADPTGTLTSNPLPPIDPLLVTPLTYTYYDDYTWSGHQSFASSYLSKTTAAGNPYAENPSSYSKKTRGMITGSKVRVLGSDPGKWLTTTTYYDDKGRVLQTRSTNFSGGTDVVTNKYDFSGKLLSSYVVNHNNNSTVSPETRVLTENHYDAAGRLLTVTKTINDQSSTERVIATNTYDELGRLKTKELGNSLETLNYTYNIRGWLTGINRQYAGGSGSHYFGMGLNYDYGFTQNQYNGNIAGQIWRTSGDSKRRAYGFSYDDINRLTKADFTQYSSGWNTSAGVDYTVSNLNYDANGNITSLKRLGLISTSSGTVDNLTYGYQSNSNQLDHVTDNGGTSTKLGDFKDGHTGSGDYSYDANGNLKKDLNKGISSITYNYLNKPEIVDFGSKGTIQFIYDATGNKLQKIVTDQTGSTAKKVVTTYLNGFVYRHIGGTAKDTLQFFPTEEGRARYIAPYGSTAASYVYDYFIKDHLGNTRVVLTEQTDFTHYIATMEPDKEAKEEALFYNLNSTRTPKPMDYPQDNTTEPNQAVAKLNGKDPDKRIGPSIILKVMAGDTIQAAVRAYYKQQAEPRKKASIPAEQMLAGLLQAFTAPAAQDVATHAGNLAQNARLTGPGLTAADLRSLKQKKPNNKKLAKPKAYLNYVFFDKQLNFVEEGSGVKQVDAEAGELETLSSGKMVAKENGYVYVFTSNESSQDVFFDNFGVMDITGPVLEETHYYPFGLTMSGISTVTPLKLESKRKFNSIEFNHKEFSDGSGLDLYTAKFRGLDPQIGRWWQLDPKPNTSLSPYAAMGLNPMLHTDILGDTIIPYTIYNSNYTYTKAYDRLSFSKTARNTMNLFREGGKYSSVTLNFTFFKDRNNNYKSGIGNQTTYNIITKDGKTIPAYKNLKLARAILKDPNSGKGSFRIDIKSNYFSTVKSINADAYYVYTAEDLLHEVQHGVIGLDGLLKTGTIPSQHEQHLNYLRETPYSTERFNFYKEYQKVWLPDYQNRINNGWNTNLNGDPLYNTPDEFIKYQINDFVNY